MSEFVKGTGVVYTLGTNHRELVGKAISTLRELGGRDIVIKDAIFLLMSKYDIAGVDAVKALDIGLATRQIIKRNGTLHLNETLIREYGAEEHRVKLRRESEKVKNPLPVPTNMAKAQKPEQEKVIDIQRPVPRRTAPTPSVSEKYVSNEEGLKFLQKTLTEQKGNTMLVTYCRRDMRNKGVGHKRITEIMTIAVKTELMENVGGFVTWTGSPADTDDFDTISMPGM